LRLPTIDLWTSVSTINFKFASDFLFMAWDKMPFCGLMRLALLFRF
jgi:hypothetical protein